MSSSDDLCWIYKGWRSYNNTRNIIPLGYEGIPQNLLLNIVGWMIMIVVFSILRKKAWNYGRIAFYKHDTSNFNYRSQNDALLQGVKVEGAQRTNTTTATNGNGRRSPVFMPQQSDVKTVTDDGFFTWIATVLRLTDEQIFLKCGPDAVRYLSFQRHLIFLGCVVAVVSIVIVLPINFQGGNLQSNIGDFKSSTISNLDNSSKLLWVHVFLTLIYLVVAIAVLRHFSKSLAVSDLDPDLSRSVMITRIAKSHIHPEIVEQHFSEIYPSFEIDEISFAYNISALQLAETNRNTAAKAKEYWENYYAKHQKRPKMLPYACGKLCCCCRPCGFNSVDAIEYYVQEEEKYKLQVTEELNTALKRPLGIAFVTFTSVEMAGQVVKDYRWIAQTLRQSKKSEFSRNLKSDQWVVGYAPLPEDIYWENISLSYKAWWFRFFIINTILLVTVIVYSTPVHILNAVDLLVVAADPGTKKTFYERVKHWGGIITAGLFADTAPTLLLWLTAVTLPSLVSLTDRIIGFWTRTNENRSRMIKTFTFLLFMVIILPSLGTRSMYVYIMSEQYHPQNVLSQIRCIFYTGNGIFFINYVITSSFLGTASELMRLPELLYYAVRLCFAKSSAEMDTIRQSSVWDFQFGSQYAWTMLNFTMFVIFSPVSPLITPFGLVYIIMKHCVDRYNIYFAYAPCKVDKHVHLTAINFVVVTMFLLQIVIVLYTLSIERDAVNDLLKVFAVICFCFSAALLISQVCFNSCTNLSPISYVQATQKEEASMEELTARGAQGNSEATAPLRKCETDGNHHPKSAAYKYHKRSASWFLRRATAESELDRDRLGRYFPKILRSLNIAELVNLENMYRRCNQDSSLITPESRLKDRVIGELTEKTAPAEV